VLAALSPPLTKIRQVSQGVPRMSNAPPAKGRRRSGSAQPLGFRLDTLPEEIASLVVDHLPLCAMARLALTHTDWAERVQRSLHRFECWRNSYTNHRCCHTLTCEARALVAPEDCWSWSDHLHVLEAVAIRQHPSEVVWLVEALVGSAWWEPRYFDEEAVGRAVSRCLVGRRTRRELAPETVLQFYDMFAAQRNPGGRTTHCGGTPDGQAHTEDCGGFCADNEIAARAWSLRALTKPLSTSAIGQVQEAATVALCMKRASLSPNDAAFFLLNYIGAVWEMWDFTPADAHTLAKLAIELGLDVATVAALLSRLAEEEAAASFGAGGPAALSFPCTSTLLREWASAASFPTAFSMPDRACVLNSLAAEAQRPGFKDAAGAVMLELLAHDHVAVPMGLDSMPHVGERRRCACRCGSAGEKAAFRNKQKEVGEWMCRRCH
jgi:hypothetical protein